MSDEMKNKSLTEQLKNFDLQPKIVSDFAVRTKIGAAVSIFAVLMAFVLFNNELRDYLTTERVQVFEVDDVHGAQMRINFDVSFPHTACAAVSVEATDASGSYSIDVLHNISKIRINKDGDAVGAAEKDEMKGVHSASELMDIPKTELGQQALCQSCHGAKPEGECCNTCDELREAFREAKMAFFPHKYRVCTRQTFLEKIETQLQNEEGCRLAGFLDVPKVPGTFQFAPNHDLQHALSHHKDLVDFTYKTFDATHTVNALNFGSRIPGNTSPLDNRPVEVQNTAAVHQYFVKLVPTVYNSIDNESSTSFQYSVTEHTTRLSLEQSAEELSSGLLPSVVFNYELSPIRSRITETRKSFGHFLTKCCAIVGGVFTVMGLIDAILHKYTQRKITNKAESLMR